MKRFFPKRSSNHYEKKNVEEYNKQHDHQRGPWKRRGSGVGGKGIRRSLLLRTNTTTNTASTATATATSATVTTPTTKSSCSPISQRRKNRFRHRKESGDDASSLTSLTSLDDSHDPSLLSTTTTFSSPSSNFSLSPPLLHHSSFTESTQTIIKSSKSSFQRFCLQKEPSSSSSSLLLLPQKELTKEHIVQTEDRCPLQWMVRSKQQHHQQQDGIGTSSVSIREGRDDQIILQRHNTSIKRGEEDDNDDIDNDNNIDNDNDNDNDNDAIFHHDTLVILPSLKYQNTQSLYEYHVCSYMPWDEHQPPLHATTITSVEERSSTSLDSMSSSVQEEVEDDETRHLPLYLYATIRAVEQEGGGFAFSCIAPWFCGPHYQTGNLLRSTESRAFCIQNLCHVADNNNNDGGRGRGRGGGGGGRMAARITTGSQNDSRRDILLYPNIDLMLITSMIMIIDEVLLIADL